MGGDYELAFGIIWEFPKLGGTLLWGPYKDPTIEGTILGSPF